MSQYADNGIIATQMVCRRRAHINRMSDDCGGCRYDPRKRFGGRRLPVQSGLPSFLDRNTERLRGNQPIAQSLAGPARLKDLPAVVEQKLTRGSRAP
jgi:deoxyribodipyrimidine photolyase-related protein